MNLLPFFALSLVILLALALASCWLAVRFADCSNVMLDRIIIVAVLPVLALLFVAVVFGFAL